MTEQLAFFSNEKREQFELSCRQDKWRRQGTFVRKFSYSNETKMTNKKTHNKPQKTLYQYKQRQSSRKPLGVTSVDEQTEDQRIQQRNSERTHRFLSDAIRTKDKSRVKELLERKSDLDPVNLGKFLWKTILNDEFEIASMLVEAGADFEVPPRSHGSRSSFLHKVVQSRNPNNRQLVISMIEHGSDVKSRDKNGRTVIYRAIEANSSIDLIEELLKRGARSDSSLIHLALKHTSADRLLPMLLCDDFLDDERSSFVARALFCLSCMVGDEDRILDIARVLLGMKLPIREIDEDGLTLNCAVESNKVKMVQLLIDYGFDVNKAAMGCMLPLYAASSLHRSAMTELLIRAGAKINDRGPEVRALEGRFAIHAACRSGSMENMRVLLRNGADINHMDSRGYTPFRYIEFDGSMSVEHELVIRHLAILISKRRKVSECDLMIIANHPGMQMYFARCLYELEMMKINKIVHNTSFFSCFDKGRSEFAFLTRNCNFSKYYNDRKHKFPIYQEEMDFAFHSALQCKGFFKEKEEALCQSLEMTLPYVPLEKIVFYFYLNDCK